ncbi:MAG: thioredoxin family protein [Cyanobacteria bacterium PR.3.49]|nr:thioredoxin family protein [Cyanobacteria bacterium PR.3.49]
MVLVNSTMRPLGSLAPDFSLPSVVDGKTYSLASFAGKKALLIIFACRHCPYVVHVKEELAKLGNDYSKEDIAIVAISSNDAENYKDDAPEKLKEFAQELGLSYPLLYDESQAVAKDYTAACTPDFFLFDEKRKLSYRGQLDGARPGNSIPVTGEDLRAAIDCLLQDKPVSADQKPSAGCNIKWKAGNAPSYFG